MSNQPATTMNIKNISEQLWQTNQQGIEPKVYVLLDAARDKQIEPLVRLGKLRSECLYQGKLDYAMARSAPYLVRLEKDHPQTDEILRKGWGNSWGVFAITYPPATLINIRHNCRKIAKVKGPGGKNLVFRYYDPRVLRSYLPTCSTDEAKQVFGPITEFIIEGKEPGTIHRFKRSEEGVVDVNKIVEIDLKNELTVLSNINLTDVVVEGDDDEDITQLKSELGDVMLRQVIGELKLAPLVRTSPNDIAALKLLLNQALLLCASFGLKFTEAEPLTKLALAIELWQLEYFAENDWVVPVLMSEEYSAAQKVDELYLEKNFRELGEQTVNFPVYCILRFKNRYPDTDYDNAAIHMAAEIALVIAIQYKVTGLTNSYLCTEMVLLNGDNFMTDKECIEIQNNFTNISLSEDEKVSQSINWLHSQLS